jgi:hypothetical protein
MMFPQPVLVTRRDGIANREEKRFWFPVDPASLKVVESITNRVVLESSTAQGERLASTPRIVIGGSGVSGPTFVDNAAYREWVWTNFHARTGRRSSLCMWHFIWWVVLLFRWRFFREPFSVDGRKVGANRRREGWPCRVVVGWRNQPGRKPARQWGRKPGADTTADPVNVPQNFTPKAAAERVVERR